MRGNDSDEEGDQVVSEVIDSLEKVAHNGSGDEDLKGASDAEELTEKVLSLNANFNESDLYAGNLTVRFAERSDYLSTSDEEVKKRITTSFTELPIHSMIKKAIIQNRAWEKMSKIQQIGIPMILSNPPRNFMGQARAGTGKTGTFVLSVLARIVPENMDVNDDRIKRVLLSSPKAIILAPTRELVTQIPMEVNALGEFVGVRARKVMSSRGTNGEFINAPWSLQPGEDFEEEVVVGTPGMVKNYLNAADREKPRKPCIIPSNVRVLVLYEADRMLQFPPHGFANDCLDVRKMILARSPNCQILLFSATFSPEGKRVADYFISTTQPMPEETISDTLFDEVTLERKDILDKVVNFLVVVEPGSAVRRLRPQLVEEEVYKAKYYAILDIWASLSTYSAGQTIIFVKTRKRAQQLADFLHNQGIIVGQIHSDIAKYERETVYRDFNNGKLGVLVATNISSRGIDNPNITLVINVDLPEKLSIDSKFGEPDPETFVHRIERSGRWTKKGAYVSLISPLSQFPDLTIMNQIEKELFLNQEVNRPLIQVPDPALLGEMYYAILQEEIKTQKIIELAGNEAAGVS